jgi:hypothetical protein
MIAQRYYTDNIPISLKDIVYAYNSSCPSFCNYDDYIQLPYILTSTVLLEVLLKKILLKVKGKYRGVHVPIYLTHSLSSLGLSIRSFTNEEVAFLKLDHSYLRYDWSDIIERQVREEVVDGLFEYFLDLALQLDVE